MFYLRYHYYPIYFPLMALSQWAQRPARRAPTTSSSAAPARPADSSQRCSRRLNQHLVPERCFDAISVLADTDDGHAILLKKKLSGEKKFPLVLMLEPLHACNLTCTGCGRIREYASTIKDKLTVDECLAAVDECGAPCVSICGGEPMIYPGIDELVAKILERKKHIYLCTNGMFIRKKLAGFKPTDRFFFNVHLDGMEATHDMAVEREGVFAEAIDGIKAAKAAGFLVCTNTTIYKETDMHEIAVLFAYLTELGVDGFMMSPAYGYAAVQETNPTGRAGDLHDPRRHPREVPRGQEAAGVVPAEHLAGLPGVPARRARAEVHRLGQSRPATSTAGKAPAT